MSGVADIDVGADVDVGTAGAEGAAADAQDEIGELIRMVAREGFGFSELRDGQLDAMRAVIEGRDTLCVLPTGGGKSAVYQIPALVLAGPAVVVSPLIALQRDQVRSLTERLSALLSDVAPTGADRPVPGGDALAREATAGRGPAGGVPAVAANSDASASARRAAFDAVRQGQTEFLFLAPEQIAREDVRAALRAAKPSLFVVDEAHCVASWGHDFRPDYLRLGQMIEDLGHPPVVALTATAAPPVRREIRERLRMRDHVEVVRGFDRPEIFLSVSSFTTEDAKRASLVERIAAEAKPALVYAATRRATEELAAEIAELGLSARAYHAGLRAAQRREIEAAYTADQCDVIVATTAFGMGIDKPNVRTVIHAEVADSLDSYYQEIGPAGTGSRRSPACSTGRRTSGCAVSRPAPRWTRRRCGASRFCSGTPTGRSRRANWRRRRSCVTPRSPGWSTCSWMPKPCSSTRTDALSPTLTLPSRGRRPGRDWRWARPAPTSTVPGSR
nr:RecQ family ATP-dependent DNA helicase [Frankia sp. AiPa1]